MICLYIFNLYLYLCILGGISATVTTPLDVAKTRIMLANRTILSSQLTILNVLHETYIKNGFRG